MSRHRADLREVEQSPDGRYVRFDEKLGNGAYKEVYLAYDTETGKEVAWNTVEMRRLPSAEKRRIRSETEILAELQHPHIINFYHVWESREKDQICFTTEIVTSGTLKQYTSRVKGIKLKVIKKWCRQILNALDYLHAHHPPIIHRDLKCDNIFINGGTGEIRLGDFGLSAHRTCTHVASVLGTPEFMAPELYDENYSESVDVYAFGMCLLEMTSKEYPYEECSNAAQIWKKVTGGLKPDVLSRVHDKQVRQFIELCICSEEHRLSAAELLLHPFLSFRKSDAFARDNLVVTVEPKSRPTSRPGSKPNSKGEIMIPAGGQGQQQTSPQNQTQKQLPAVSTKNGHGTGTATTPSAGPMNGNGFYRDPSPSQPPTPLPVRNLPSSGTHHPPPHMPHTPQPVISNHPPTLPHSASIPLTSVAPPPPGERGYGDGPPGSAPSVVGQTGVSAIMVEIESAQGATANIILHIHLDGGRRKKQIKFALDFRHDTSMSLAGEMVQSLKLPDGERTQMLIASAMEARIEPVRKLYFAQMAEESVSPNATGVEIDEANMLEQAIASGVAPPTNHPAIFQHTSYTNTPTNANNAGGNGTIPAAAVAARGSIYRQGSFPPSDKSPQPPNTNTTNNPNQPPSNVSRPLSLPVNGGPLNVNTSPAAVRPAISPLPPHPSQLRPGTIATTAPGLQQPGMIRTVSNPQQPLQEPMSAGGTRGSIGQASNAQQQQPRPATASGMNTGTGGTISPIPAPSRPNTTTGGRSSLPPQPTQPLQPKPEHKHSFSVPFGEQFGSEFAQAQAQAQQQQAALAQAAANTPTHQTGHGAVPPQSPQRGSFNAGGSRLSSHVSFPVDSGAVGPTSADGLLTLDSFESSEEYETYLQTEFKSLTVGQLKERLKLKPGGTELLKACFEKSDMIEMLLKITVQESCTPAVGGRSPHGNIVAAGAGFGSQHHSPLQHHQSLPIQSHQNQHMPSSSHPASLPNDGTRRPLNAVEHILAASITGISVSFLTNPLWVIKTRMFLDHTPASDLVKLPLDARAKLIGKDGRATAVVVKGGEIQTNYKGLIHALQAIWKTEGISGLYRGFVPGLFGVSHGAVQFMCYEELKKWRLAYKQEHVASSLDTQAVVWSTPETVAMSITSKAFAACATYPYQVLRSRMQASPTPVTVRSVVTATWRAEGIAGFYRGLWVNLVKVMPAACTVFVVYEQMSGYMKRHATYVQS